MNGTRDRILFGLGYLIFGTAAIVRVAATHRVFSATADEPAHIACGLDWLRGLPYTADPTHPPLERVLSAIPLYLDKAPDVPTNDPPVVRGNEMLYSGDYVRNISRARLGSLLFLGLGLAAVGIWGTRAFSPAVGLLAAGLFTLLPPILGHAGLATTDMAVAALFPLAVVLFDSWLKNPTIWRSISFGLALGFGMLSKFSFPLFFAAAALIVVVVRIVHKNARFSAGGTLATLAVMILIVWAGYRFEFGTLAKSQKDAELAVTEPFPNWIRPQVASFSENVPVPAPLLLAGEAMVEHHDRDGHLSFLFGKVSQHGWWYYFPVALFFKTPIPFLLLAAVGFVLILMKDRRRIEMALIPLALLAAVLPASIDIGIRHILPIYAPLAIVAASGALRLWKTTSFRAISAILVIWMVVGSVAAHPDYVAWFNEAAGHHPERILVDSNLDWGQDYLRLVKVLREKKIAEVFLLPFGSAQLSKHGIDAEPIPEHTRPPGWYVLPETALALDPRARDGAFDWLMSFPMTRVGKSLRLCHVQAPIKRLS